MTAKECKENYLLHVGKYDLREKAKLLTDKQWEDLANKFKDDISAISKSIRKRGNIVKIRKQTKEKFYKNRYALAFYGLDDYLVHIFDNVAQICEYLGVKKDNNTVTLTIRHLVTGFIETTNLFGVPTKLYLIDMMEGE